MRVTVTIVCLALLTATGALAQRKNLSDDMGNADRIICKEIIKPGSRIALSRSCHTAAEWARIRRETRHVVDKIQALKVSRN